MENINNKDAVGNTAANNSKEICAKQNERYIVSQELIPLSEWENSIDRDMLLDSVNRILSSRVYVGRGSSNQKWSLLVGLTNLLRLDIRKKLFSGEYLDKNERRNLVAKLKWTRSREPDAASFSGKAISYYGRLNALLQRI